MVRVVTWPDVLGSSAHTHCPSRSAAFKYAHAATPFTPFASSHIYTQTPWPLSLSRASTHKSTRETFISSLILSATDICAMLFHCKLYIMVHLLSQAQSQPCASIWNNLLCMNAFCIILSFNHFYLNKSIFKFLIIFLIKRKTVLKAYFLTYILNYCNVKWRLFINLIFGNSTIDL